MLNGYLASDFRPFLRKHFVKIYTFCFEINMAHLVFSKKKIVTPVNKITILQNNHLTIVDAILQL